MRLLNEAWDEEEFEAVDAVEEPLDPIVTVDDVAVDTAEVTTGTVVTEDPSPVILVKEPANAVEVKVASTVTAEVINPEFDETRREIARDMLVAHHDGRMTLAELARKLAAVFGSKEAAFDFIGEDNIVDQPEVVETETEVKLEDPIVESKKDLKEAFKVKAGTADEEIKEYNNLLQKTMAAQASVMRAGAIGFEPTEAESDRWQEFKQQLQALEDKIRDRDEDITWGLKTETKDDFLKRLEEIDGRIVKKGDGYTFVGRDIKKEDVPKILSDERFVKYITEDVNIDKVEVEIEGTEKDDSKSEDEKTEEEKVAETPDMPKAGIQNYIANELNVNIVGEWDTIKKYNDFVATLEADPMAQDYATIINVIKDITAEEHEHIGQLQQALKLVSPNSVKIAAGEEEGEKQLEVPVAAGDPEVDGIEPTEKDLAADITYSPEEAETLKNDINKVDEE